MSNYLPRTVSKSELANYWGVTLKKMWADILTPDLIESWGFDFEEVKRKYILTPGLTLHIYDHFDIVDLNESVTQQLERLREKRQKAKAVRLEAALR